MRRASFLEASRDAIALRFFVLTTGGVMSNPNSRPSRNRRSDVPPSRSDQDVIADLQAQIVELQAVVERLQTSRNELEDSQEMLRSENLRLRREMTLANLVEDLEASIEDVVEEDGSVTVPSPAQRLYEQLPPSFPFPLFFRMVEQEGLDMAQARRYLVRYLADGLLVQSGAYLKKIGDEENDSVIG
jgi:hypothetical protein